MKTLRHPSVLAGGTVILLHLMVPRKAHAYLDPGSGSYFLQIGVAALLGILFAVKLFWKKIRDFIESLVSGDGEHVGNKER